AAIAGLDDALVHDGCELHTRRPGAARRHDDLEHGEVHGHLGGFAEAHLRAATHRAPPPPEVDAAVDRPDAGVTRRFDATLLYEAEIGEVAVDLQLDRAVRGLLAVVRDADVLPHAPTDVPVAHDRERAVGPAGARPGSEHEGGA